ncbi:hypothetical protein [Sphingomonas profundi]|uniref:hypothetical protein n=1 Tax=Alterirhizorhabdus profundi TaxID=2681549 RepID=UPI0012E99242|nr:hypothetical protein [Sphingomonas profundi]
MIDLGKIRASVEEAPGDIVALSKAQIRELLDDVERGYVATRQLKMRSAPADALGGLQA